MEDNILLNDIIHNHSERMGNLRRYYPFFRLWDNGLNLYKDGQYADLDMPYITMAVLRYFIEENSFNDRSVTYEMYASFLGTVLERDFDLHLKEDQKNALISYIFDKLCNEGKAFSANWFDPEDKKTKTIRVKLFESHFQDGKIVYDLTPDAIEFYLDTKEVREESPMTIEQILLGKMVVSKDFKGGLEVIRRINQEVSKMVAQKEAIVRLFGHNVFEGARALEDFSGHGMKWFEEEQKMFASNKELVDQAMQMAVGQKAVREIAAMDIELKKAMKRHGDLLAACTELQVAADEMIRKAKHNRFRKRADFEKIREVFFESDRMDGLEQLIEPLFGLKTCKTFNFSQLDDMLDYKPEEKQLKETIDDAPVRNYIYEDESAEQRIQGNFDYLLKVLFDQLMEKDRVELTYLVHLYMMKFGREIYLNGDFYAFLAHLSQKTDYDLQNILTQQDTFLEGVMAHFLEKEANALYRGLKFKIIFDHAQVIHPVETFEVSNMIFERTAK